MAIIKHRTIIIIISAILILAIAAYLTISSLRDISSNTNKDDEETIINIFDEFDEIDRDTLIKYIESDKIKGAALSSDKLYIICKDNTKVSFMDTNNEMASYIKLNGTNLVAINKAATGEIDTTGNTNNMFVNFLYLLIRITVIIIVIGLALRLAINIVGKHIIKGAVGQNLVDTFNTKTKKEVEEKKEKTNIPNVKFSDVEGIKELKVDIERLVDCLKNPEKYKEIGARPSKGVILYGPPGTGKTLLAKAIAGEAGVPFFSAVGSDFMEMYVGVGAKRVRDLYKKARKSAPCIVFIDEIDAIACTRGTDGDNGERHQTINAMLSELDGFDSTANVMTICATNTLDDLDPAFTRAGRFDLKLAVPLPDREARYNILKIHSKNKKFDDTVNFDNISRKSSGFSGADLEALLNEAAMIAGGKDKKFITNEDIEDAFFKIILKGNKKPRKEIDEINRTVAWHEAGHTLLTKLLTEDSVPSVTIVGCSSGAGGVTFRAPKEEGLTSKKYLRSLICVMYAGRAAEEIYKKDDSLITTGASQDIKQATAIIKEYLASYGMGDIGMLDISQLRRDYEDIVDEASILAKELYTETLNTLKENYDTLERLALTLLDKETLYEEEIDEIINTK